VIENRDPCLAVGEQFPVYPYRHASDASAVGRPRAAERRSGGLSGYASLPAGQDRLQFLNAPRYGWRVLAQAA
jgi:hypothetical protein